MMYDEELWCHKPNRRRRRRRAAAVTKRTIVRDHSPNFSLLSMLFDIKSVAIVFIRNKKVGLCQLNVVEN